GQDEEDNGRGARNQFGKPPRHVSHHDITFEDCTWLTGNGKSGLDDVGFR
ncbi:MAG: hypothetical protein QOF56_2948, partial [Acidobacteriaceae bacterium]|nr:hypothetical protein [Acidobacteriaceae bacterium]